MADAKIQIASLPAVTLPMTGNELIPISQAGVAKVMKPGDVAAFQGSYIKSDGSIPFTGNESMGGFLLKNLGAPEDDNDAVRFIEVKNRTEWASLEW